MNTSSIFEIKQNLHSPHAAMRDIRAEAVSFGFGNKFMAGVGDMTEAKILRLVFHDCAKYKDGTGGCDGYVVMKYQFFRLFWGAFFPWASVLNPTGMFGVY